MVWGKAPLKSPCHRCPVEDWAFSMYAIEIEEREELINKARDHLIFNPEDEDIIQELYGLTDEEWACVLGVCF